MSRKTKEQLEREAAEVAARAEAERKDAEERRAAEELIADAAAKAPKDAPAMFVITRLAEKPETTAIRVVRAREDGTSYYETVVFPEGQREHTVDAATASRAIRRGNFERTARLVPAKKSE